MLASMEKQKSSVSRRRFLKQTALVGMGSVMLEKSAVARLSGFSPAEIKNAVVAPFLTNGRFGGAISFSGTRFSEGCVELGAPYWVEASLQDVYLRRPLTVEIWVKLDDTAGSNILVAAGLEDFASHWRLQTTPGTGELCVYLPGSAPELVNTQQNIVDHQWHYVVMTLEPRRVALAIDGVTKADAVLSNRPLPAGQAGSLYIGAYPPQHEGCSGLIDELRISSSAHDVAAKPDGPLTVDSDTVGLWHFDQFVDNAYPDLSKFGNGGCLAPRAAQLALELNRGITIDRQYVTLPSTPVFTRMDIRLIKSMGFEYVKLVANPDVHKAGWGVVPASMDYLNSAIRLVVGEGLPVVVTIHPMADFKYTMFGNPQKFEEFLSFLGAFTRSLAADWKPHQLALQLCTEPFGNTKPWTALQYRMWLAARKGMPGHTLILSGDQVGRPKAVLNVHPVNDSNVMYCFTSWDPFAFTLQGAKFFGGIYPYLQQVPYPSSPGIIAAHSAVCLGNEPRDLRARAQSCLREYGNAHWGPGVIDERFRVLDDWNTFFGGALKLWCAEFGAYAQADNTSVDRYEFIKDIRQTFDKYQIGWSYWSYNETFTVLQPNVRRKMSSIPDPAWRDPRMLNALALTPTSGSQ